MGCAGPRVIYNSLAIDDWQYSARAPVLLFEQKLFFGVIKVKKFYGFISCICVGGSFYSDR